MENEKINEIIDEEKQKKHPCEYETQNKLLEELRKNKNEIHNRLVR
jgi:hypothetical protein